MAWKGLDRARVGCKLEVHSLQPGSRSTLASGARSCACLSWYFGHLGLLVCNLNHVLSPDDGLFGCQGSVVPSPGSWKPRTQSGTPRGSCALLNSPEMSVLCLSPAYCWTYGHISQHMPVSRSIEITLLSQCSIRNIKQYLRSQHES